MYPARKLPERAERQEKVRVSIVTRTRERKIPAMTHHVVPACPFKIIKGHMCHHHITHRLVFFARKESFITNHPIVTNGHLYKTINVTIRITGSGLVELTCTPLDYTYFLNESFTILYDLVVLVFVCYIQAVVARLNTTWIVRYFSLRVLSLFRYSLQKQSSLSHHVFCLFLQRTLL